jgi:hypothetical protein
MWNARAEVYSVGMRTARSADPEGAGMTASAMTSRERLLAALDREVPDRLPVTTHHLMPSFLTALDGDPSPSEFFTRFGFDSVTWVAAHRPDAAAGAYHDPGQGPPGYLEPAWVASDEWRIEREPIGADIKGSGGTRYRIQTPKGMLSMALREGRDTAWVTERLIKEPGDLDLFARYAPAPLCDVGEVERLAAATAGEGIVRGQVPGFDIYGQPGCWQDAAVLFGIEELILATADDPGWVREFLGVLGDRKLKWLESSRSAPFDLLEHGGGDASTTVISPAIFESFVAPFDAPLIDAAHEAGHRVVYHTCGGMMPIVEQIAGMGPDAMETFTPPSLGGDADLAEAKRRVGERVCMIGGFDQARFLTGCDPAKTAAEVRRCFREAGEGGGYILAPSDHFFDAESDLLKAMVREAHACRY